MTSYSKLDSYIIGRKQMIQYHQSILSVETKWLEISLEGQYFNQKWPLKSKFSYKTRNKKIKLFNKKWLLYQKFIQKWWYGFQHQMALIQLKMGNITIQERTSYQHIFCHETKRTLLIGFNIWFWYNYFLYTDYFWSYCWSLEQ